MRLAVTDDEVASYRKNGFVVIEDLLDEDELQGWRSAINDASSARRARMPGDAEQYPGWFRAPEDEYYDKVFTQKINLWMSDAKVRSIVLDEHLGHLAARLAGVRGVRLWQDQALLKEPFANPTSYHLDVPYWAFDSADALTIWVSLNDATMENGCMCYLPGTHLAKRFDNVRIGRDIGSLFEVYPEWREIEPVFCPVPAGSAVVHNGLTAHGAGANMTPHPRGAMTIAYMPDGCTFNGKPNILPEAMLRSLRVGDLLDDEKQSPLVYAEN